MRRRQSLRRGRQARPALCVAVLLVLTACTGGSSTVVTVTSNSTAPGPGNSSTAVPTSSSGSPTPGSGKSTASTVTRGSTPSPNVVPANDNGGVGAGGTEPDGFRITKLKAGQKAPQFIVFSFDGVGWDQKWQYWFGLMQKVPLHFTGFLSGTYMLSKQTSKKYTGPGHAAGDSAIGWDEPADIPVEINNLNKSLSLGNEVGTHFNGHFCDPTDSPGGDTWDQGNWKDELNQFFGLIKNVDVNNGITNKLDVTAAEIRGERTPCLQGGKRDLYPALEAHGMDYDSSITKGGLAWPVKSSDGKIWEMGMSQFPVHGTGHATVTMDYNFYVQQEPHTVDGGPVPTLAKSQADSAQVLATYQDMLRGAETDGVNEPLIIGNHFNDWNNNAYSDAVANFALAECGKPGIKCVPFRDLVDWMNAQDPKVLAALQNHRSNLGGCPYLKFPHCDGLIQY